MNIPQAFEDWWDISGEILARLLKVMSPPEAYLAMKLTAEYVKQWYQLPVNEREVNTTIRKLMKTFVEKAKNDPRNDQRRREIERSLKTPPSYIE